ncbi:MAG: methanogenesis marker 16 metalloprotein, partial [Euryarchaeota archaeon]|nr:methanogenesis marker 16 metalloprotein [Euryarchaeota archaeon]
DAPFSFTRADKVFLNEVPAYVGPCPNERLGVLDVMVFGTTHGVDDQGYGAGHLFRDLVERKPVSVRVVTDAGATFSTTTTLDDITYAKLFGTRNTFKNYSAFVNCSSNPVSTIFHAVEFGPDMSGATFSGCGQLNPIKNDPQLKAIGIGTRILFNGAQGFIIGDGTRSSIEKPNLIAVADMHSMMPEYMGGFTTSAGPECVVSWAVPIPVVEEGMLDAIKQLDIEVPLPVMDVDQRERIGMATYGDGWSGVDLEVAVEPWRCIGCDHCLPQDSCPTDAIHVDDGAVLLDRVRCFNCGLCATLCPVDVFAAELGVLHFDYNGADIGVPIVLRQSDRKRAIELSQILKRSILDGTFRLTEMVERIVP